MNIEQKTATAICNEVMKLDCQKYLPFPEAKGEFHHGYYQAIKDVLDIVHKYQNCTTYHANQVSALCDITQTNKGEWCVKHQEFAKDCLLKPKPLSN